MSGVMELVAFSGDMLETHGRQNSLIYHENCIRRDMAKTRECFMYIGFHLLDINDAHLYDTVYHKNSGNYCKTIYQYAEQELDIKKSTTYQLMTVASTFHSPGTPRAGLDRAYIDYSFSQLVELSTVPKEFHQYCDPHLTIKQIREWKQGKKVTAAFGFGKDSEGHSSVFGLCRDFQIPPDLYFVEYRKKSCDTAESISFQTSGMDAQESGDCDFCNGDVMELPEVNQLTTDRPIRDSSVGRLKPVADWYRDMSDRAIDTIVGNLCAWFGNESLNYDTAFELLFKSLTDKNVVDSIRLFVERYLNS